MTEISGKAVVMSTGISILPVLEIAPQLEPFKAAAADLEAQAERAVIDSEDAWQRGSNFVTVCEQRWDQLETLRRTVKGPIDDYASFIQALFLPIQKRFKAAKDAVNTKRLTFHQAEEARRKEAQEKVRKAQEDAALTLAAERESQGDTAGASAIMEAATMAPLARAPVAKLGTTNSFGKSDSVRKTWTAKPEKPMDVLAAIIAGNLPIDLIEFKQVELNKAAKRLGAVGTFFGLKVFQTENLQQR